ncbi:MAG: hypothetical protein RCG15_04970 [Candidatus Rickettsia vulgarisii]
MANIDLTTESLKSRIKDRNILDLSKCDIKDQDINAVLTFIKQNPQITTLNLRNNGIGAEGTKYLTESRTLAKLTSLHLSSNNTSAEGAVSLAKLLLNPKCKINIERQSQIIISTLSPFYKENKNNSSWSNERFNI